MLVAAASHGLTAAVRSRRAPPDGSVTGDVWSAVLDGARRGRLVPLLHRMVREGPVTLTADQEAQLDAAAREAAMVVVALEGHLLEVAGQLDGMGVAWRLLKGPALARLDYGNADDRCWADVDILAPADVFDAVVTMFTRQGFIRHYPEPRPGFDRRFAKGVSFAAPGGWELDLHRTWVNGPYAHLIDIAGVLSRTDQVEVGGRALPALAREDRVLHACFHAGIANYPPRLLPFRDVAELLGQPFDVDAVRRRARAWRAEGVLALAVRGAWSALDLDGPCALGDDLLTRSFTVAERPLLRAYAGCRYPVQLLGSLRTLPGLADKAAFLRAVLLPTHDYVNARYAGPLDRWLAGGKAAWSWCQQA